jgi:branched-chain amino acid transport system permease protein
MTPEFMNWTRSGELMFIVILGGIATTSGPVLGAFVLLLLEDMLSGSGFLPRWVNDHWQFYLGIFLILVVLYARRGLAGLLRGGKDG